MLQMLLHRGNAGTSEASKVDTGFAHDSTDIFRLIYHIVQQDLDFESARSPKRVVWWDCTQSI